MQGAPNYPIFSPITLSKDFVTLCFSRPHRRNHVDSRLFLFVLVVASVVSSLRTYATEWAFRTSQIGIKPGVERVSGHAIRDPDVLGRRRSNVGRTGSGPPGLLRSRDFRGSSGEEC
jgi:hypothetical protein